MGSFATSLVLHGVVLAGGAWLLSRSLTTRSSERARVLGEVEIAIQAPDGVELPRMSRAGLSGAPDPQALPEPDLVTAGGGARTSRPDMAHKGRGGSDTSLEAALNLADTNDGLTLDRDPMNRLEQSQVQRMRTSFERRSLDDRRATPTPMELAFLATGPGDLAERRPLAPTNPSNGSYSGSVPASRGALLGGPSFVPELGVGAEAAPGASRAGTADEQPGPGVPSARRGSDYRFSAAVALARPSVPRARAAVPTVERGRPNDKEDSPQDVSSVVASLVHASTAGATMRDPGPGGEAAPGAPGSGANSGLGSRSERSGIGSGPARDSGNDARLGSWFAGLKDRLGRWEDDFPRAALVEGRGGIAIIGFTVLEDGRVADVRVVRSSGIEQFDRNLLGRVKRAAPFAPPPSSAGRRTLPIHFTFDALNAAVGRQGPGRGRAPLRP